MAVLFLEPGTDATQDFALFASTLTGAGGTIATSTAQAHTGTRSFKVTLTSTDDRANASTYTGSLSAAGGLCSVWVYSVGTLASNTLLFTADQPGVATCCGVGLNTSGTLRVAGNGTSAKSGTTVLSAGTWYRISMALVITSSTVYTINVFLNGTLEVTLATGDGTLGNTTPSAWSIGPWTQLLLNGFTNTSASWSVYFDDVYIDNRTDLSDCGDIRSTAKRAFADGTLVEFTTQIGSGNSGYGSGHADEVNEQPLSETNGWSISTTTRKTEEYAIEPKSMGDVDLTLKYIVGRMGWVRASVDSTANSPVHRLILNGTTTAKTLTTSAATYTVAEDALTYPGGPDAIGLDAQYTTTPHLTRLFEAGVIVAWREDLSPTNSTVLPFAFQQRYP